MAFPSIRGSVATTNGTTATASPVVNLPASVSKGDTLFVVFRCAVAGAIGWPDANWNELVDDSPDASDDQIGVAWKKAVGNEGGTTITLSSGNGKFSAVAYCIQDAADPTVRPPELSTVATGTSAGQPDATACTPTGGAKDYLWLTFETMEGEQTGVTTYPSNFTLGQSGLANSGTAGAVTTNTTIAAAARQQNAASQDAGAWSIAGTLDDWSAYTAAFYPAAEDLSASISESTRVFERIVGAAIGVALSVGIGVFGELPKLADTVQAAMSPPPFLSATIGEQPDLREWVFGASIGAPTTTLSAGLMEGNVFHLLDQFGDLYASVSENLKISDSVTVDRTGPIEAAPIETPKADDGGFVELIGLGNPVKITDGPVIATLSTGNNLAVNFSENIRVADGPVTASYAVIEASLTEIIKAADSGEVELSKDETVRVNDTLTTFINPEQTALGEDVKVADTVTAALTGSGASLTETVKLSDTVQVTLNPEQASFTENVKVADTPATLLNPEETNPAEIVKVADTVTLTLNPEETSLIENVKIADTVQVSLNPEQTSLIENVKIVDTSSQFINPEETSPAESLKVVDTLSVSINLASELTENVKVTDSVQTLLNPEETSVTESLKISDEISAARIDAGALAATLSEDVKIADTLDVTITPIFATATEDLKVTDELSVTITPIFLSVAQETVKVADTNLQVSITPVSASISESLKVVDNLTVTITPIFASPGEAAKASDSVFASITPEFVTVQEDLKVSDSISVTLSPEETTSEEPVKISDAVSVARINAGTLAATLGDEVVKISEVVEVSITPEFGSASEDVKVQDQVSAARVDFDLLATASESLKVSDSPSVVIQLGRQAADENVKVVDVVIAALQLAVQIADESVKVVDGDPATRLNPIQATPSETVKVQDQLFVASGTTLTAILSESTKAADATTVALDPEEALGAENSKVSDQLAGVLNPEEVALTEALGIADTIQVSLDPLEVSIDENIEIEDQAPRFGGPRVLDITGGYSTIIDIVGGYSGQIIDLVGGYGEGE